MIQKISVQDFKDLYHHLPVFDVRSPSEYAHAHITHAIALPLFTDDERKIIGTAYKQEGREPAVWHGLDFFAPKMKPLITEVLSHCGEQREVVVHCWRGGMRSGAVAWLLDLYGFTVYQIEGGYKAYRHWVAEQFSKSYTCQLLGGYTGSRKTVLLHHLQQQGASIIDLEALAQHRGSAYGGIGQEQQPTQEHFENLLGEALYAHRNHSFWLEDESQRIGHCTLPPAFWHTMRTSPVYFIYLSFEQRLENIVADYGTLPLEKLIAATERIQKRFGPLETKTTIAFLQEGNIKEAFALLLKYYDKQYKKSMYNREALEELLNIVHVTDMDNATLIQTLLAKTNGTRG